jgi:GTP-binding protein
MVNMQVRSPDGTRGALIALEKGEVTGYALEGLQDRGQFFVKPGDEVYAGQVVGINNRNEDLVSECGKKEEPDESQGDTNC